MSPFPAPTRRFTAWNAWRRVLAVAGVLAPTALAALFVPHAGARLAGALGLVASGLGAALAAARGRVSVTVGADAITLKDHRGSERYPLDLVTVVDAVPGGTLRVQGQAFALGFGPGMPLHLDPEACRGMAEQVFEATAPRLLRAALEDFRRQRPVSFGALILTPTGLVHQPQGLEARRTPPGDLAWPELQALVRSMDGAHLLVLRHGTPIPWRTIPLARLRNLGLLERFLEALGRPSPGQARPA